MIKELLRTHKFAPRFGIDGPIIGMTKVDVRPGTPWHGKGAVFIEMAMSEQAVSMLMDTKRHLFIVGLFNDDPTKSSVLFVMHDVCLHESRVSISTMDANELEIMKVGAEMDYSRLEIIFGPTALDLISIAT